MFCATECIDRDCEQFVQVKAFVFVQSRINIMLLALTENAN